MAIKVAVPVTPSARLSLPLAKFAWVASITIGVFPSLSVTLSFEASKSFKEKDKLSVVPALTVTSALSPFPT